MDTKTIVNNWVLYNILLNTYFEGNPVQKCKHIDDWILI